MSTKQLNSAAENDPAKEEEAIETIAVLNGNDEENAAVSSTDTESNVSSDDAAAHAHDAGKGTTKRFVAKCGVFTAVGALAVAIGGAASVHLAGRPTQNFSSSKQVAVASGEIEIKGFTRVGDGICLDGTGSTSNRYDWVYYNLDEGDNLYDFVRYYRGGVVGSEACAKKCSKCPGRGQTDDDGVELVLRGFEYYDGRCYCLVENGATFTKSICKDAGSATYEYEGSGEIESSTGASGDCWKVNSKSSKSPKSGSKGGKRG